jgi:hypothetical protein
MKKSIFWNFCESILALLAEHFMAVRSVKSSSKILFQTNFLVFELTDQLVQIKYFKQSKNSNQLKSNISNTLRYILAAKKNPKNSNF